MGTLKILLSSLLGASLSVAAFAEIDPVQHLKSFSEFPSVDVRRLHNGDILGEPGSQMNFPQGVSAQTCFAVPVTAEEAARRLQHWDPSLHASLKAHAFHEVSQPCQAADFESLNLKSGEKPFLWLLDKTRAT